MNGVAPEYVEINENDKLRHLVPHWSENENPRIPNFGCSSSNIGTEFYQPLLVYYASRKSKNNDWMRVIWNLFENISVDKNSFRQAVHLIDELSTGKDNILEYLHNKTTSNIKTCYQSAHDQLQEEIDKADQIVDGERPKEEEICRFENWTSWYNVIVKAESMGCFAGSIRFLYHDGSDNIAWSSFCTKWSHVQTYFDNNGIKEKYAAKLVSALLKRCTSWSQIRGHYIFNGNEWKWNVLLDTTYAEPLDYILLASNLDKVETAKFEEGYICEEIIRDRLSENNLIKEITSNSNYYNSRIIDGGYFYGWHQKDGILFDWETGKTDHEPWERRRNSQLHEMQSSSKDLTIKNNHVSEEIYFGYTISFEYNQTNFKWGADNVIYLIDNDQGKLSVEVSPAMEGEEILGKLSDLIESYRASLK